MGDNGDPCSCTQFIKCCIFYYKSHKNLYQSVLQVTRKSRENTYQVLQVACVRLNLQGSFDKTIITIVPSYTGKNIACLLLLALFVTCAAHS